MRLRYLRQLFADSELTFLYFWAACNNQGNLGEMLVSPSIKSSTSGLRLDGNQTVGLRSTNEVAIISDLLLDQYGRLF